MLETLRDDPQYWELPVDDIISLRQLEINEAAAVFAMVDANRDYLSAWLPWVDLTRSPDDTEAFIIETQQKRRNGSEYGYAICVDGDPVGHMSLMHVTDEKDPEIGYWISSSMNGRGITTKAAKALTDFGLKTMELERIVIRARPNNFASNKVAEKLGYKLECTTQKDAQDYAVNVWATSSNTQQDLKSSHKHNLDNN
jgi:ribosomal-protein-serine acetyltransferase